MRRLFVLLAVVWFACAASPLGEPSVEGTSPKEEVVDSNESVEVELFSSEVIPIFEPTNDVTSDRCDEAEMNSCTNCLKTCQSQLQLCLFVAKLNDEMIELCGQESQKCRENCRKTIDVLCDCRKL
jgi:hypothetical protein